MPEEQTLTHREGASPAPSRAPSGTGLELKGLTKRFGEDVVAVDNIDLHIEHGEYVVLLGPSGCGKTTTLRMIGGHEEATSGEILLDGERIDGLTPDKRPTTTVFQHFALFPHKTVLENVAFGPKMHGVEKEERRRVALETLETVGLRELSDRKPRALSGGQQQRVALARALVTKPKALLLDEPLGDVDRLLQMRMRVELRNLQRQLGLMFIHVTHNQEEALSIADRVVVMNEGRIQQVGEPLTLQTRPANELVAMFMGDNNLIRGTVIDVEGDRIVLEDAHGGRASVRAAGHGLAAGAPAAVAVRASAVRLDEQAAGPNALECRIHFVEYLGDLVKLHLDYRGERFLAKVAGNRYPDLRGKEGTAARVSWSEDDVQLLRS